MDETQEQERTAPAGAAQAQIVARKGISLVWLVPLVALVIGGWLIFQAWSEKGPTITISFESAEGLEAGKTKIRYKDVEIGQVTDIRLSKDISHVVVSAELQKGAKRFLTDKTRFWVTRARVAAGEVSGLGTLFSGAYIGMDPVFEGEPTRHFKGLEVPPVVTSNLPGRHFLLRAEGLGSLDVGSPVYYRQIKVGQVVGYEFDHNTDEVEIQVFINAPFHEKIRQNSRFWNASGLDVSLDASGVKIDSQSLVAIMLGGIAFETPHNLDPGGPAKEGEVFRLYENHSRVNEKVYSEKSYYLLYFENNVRGLVVGSPVEFRGIKIGEVVDVHLEFDPKNTEFQIPVLVALEPERISLRDGYRREGASLVPRLIEKGLRAQVKSGNLLTGQLYVDLDIHPEQPAHLVAGDDRYQQIPTISSTIEQISESLTSTLKKLEKVPFDQIGADLQHTVQTLDKTLAQAETLVTGFNTEVTPALHDTLQQVEETLTAVEKSLGADSAVNYNASVTLEELANTIRSVRALTEYLERNPQSLIFGKKDTEQ